MIVKEQKEIQEELAHCFPQPGNPKHELLLTPEMLLVKRNGVEYRYPVSAVVSVELKKIRVMLQYLVGGLAFCLSLLAIQHNLIHPVPGLLIMMGGALLFFIGWRGRLRFTVHLHDGTDVYWFPGDLETFTRFTNTVNRTLPHLQHPEQQE